MGGVVGVGVVAGFGVEVVDAMGRVGLARIADELVFVGGSPECKWRVCLWLAIGRRGVKLVSRFE